MAADNPSGYIGLQRALPTGTVIHTARHCDRQVLAPARLPNDHRLAAGQQPCDHRDCSGVVAALVDMLNLARTSLILGSDWSSFSEAAAWMGADHTRNDDPARCRYHLCAMPVSQLYSGRDFDKTSAYLDLGLDLGNWHVPALEPSNACPAWEDVMNTPKALRVEIWDAKENVSSSGSSLFLDALAPQAYQSDESASATCPSGCLMHFCNAGGRSGTGGKPCCIRRMAARFPRPCEELPFGCPFNRLEERWGSGRANGPSSPLPAHHHRSYFTHRALHV